MIHHRLDSQSQNIAHMYIMYIRVERQNTDFLVFLRTASTKIQDSNKYCIQTPN